MRRIQVITQKEMVNPKELKGCTVVVIDVFLATSTIIFLLKNNYEPVYVMKDIDKARDFSLQQIEEHIKLGEINGEPVDGFLYPDPTLIDKVTEKKPAIICSTNGTIAINSAKEARKVYISSLINGHFIADKLHKYDDNSSIVIICSGNNNRFSMEDFVGAGQIIDHLIEEGDYNLSDSAILSREAYKRSKSLHFKDLLKGETANLLRTFNYPRSMNFVIDNFEKVNILPVFIDDKIVHG